MSTPQHARTPGNNRPKKTTPPEVREANREFLRRHPERGGRLLNPNNPADREALAEWRQIYAEAKQRNQPPAPKAAPSKPVLPCQTVKQECELESAEVACSHSPDPRKFKIKLPNTKAEERVLSVLAGHSKTKESITVKTRLKKPLCHKDKNHAQRHIVVKPPYNAPEIVTGAQHLKFDVKSSLIIPNAVGALGKIKTLYRYIWIPFETKDIYQIDVDACTTGGPAQATVKVYPDLSWNIEFAFTAGFERVRKSKYGEGGHREIENEGGYPLGFEAKVGLKYDHEEQSLGKEFKTKYIESSQWMRLLKISAGWLRKIAFYAGNVTVTFPQVAVSFKFTNSLIEREESGSVAHEGEFAIESDPLLGATLEVDLVTLLIRAATQGIPASTGIGIVVGKKVGDFLLKAREIGEKGGSIDILGLKLEGKAKVKLTLSMSGGIIASGSVKFSRDEKDHRIHATEGKIKVGGKIAFGFNGEAAVEGKVMALEVRVGVSLSGNAGFVMEGGIGVDGEGPYYGGKAYFSGAKLTFRFFTDAKIVRKPPPPDVEKESNTNSVWSAVIDPWPDNGEFKKHRFF